MAFAIPRRVGTAVQRNRVRRRLRSAARDRYLQRGGPTGWFLVVVRPGAGDASYSDLADALDAALDHFDRSDR
jgi:ribonuclease P protein component